MLVPILNEFQVRNDEKNSDENQEEDNFEINFKNAETTIEEHFQIKLKIILPSPKCWKSCSSIYQLFSLKFYITFNVPPIIVKRVLSPE